MDTKSITMLQAIDIITNDAKGSTLSEQFITGHDAALRAIGEKLGTTPTQSAVMALFMNHAFDVCISLSDIFGGTDCPTSRKLELMNDVEWLVDNHYLIRRRNHSMEHNYIIPDEVGEAFRRNVAFKPKGFEKMSPRALFFAIDELMDQRDDEVLTYEQLVREVTLLFDVNSDMAFVKKVRGFNLEDDDEMLLLAFCNSFVSSDDDAVTWGDLRFLYEPGFQRRRTSADLADGSSILFRLKLIECACADGFVDRETWKLTDSAKHQLLADLNLSSLKGGRAKGGVIRHADIKAKPLFFPTEVERQVDELRLLLQESRYRKVCQRMKKRGFHSGLTCLFYGSPGTGKTETVYQLAKLTGRDVLLVDIPQVRSMWVGESEKNTKAIFTRYAGIVRESRRAPILLFNEADALIGRRTEIHDSAADKSENTMQNIILQELENFNGIFIATTNLQGNLDRAFERRFLYKLRFDRPDVASRAKIWHAMLPELSESVVGQLASQYDFSGGQIENIARHFTITAILQGDEAVTPQAVDRFCQEETIKKDRPKVGF